MSDFRYITTALLNTNPLYNNPILAELPLTNVTFDVQLNSIGTFTGEMLLSGLDAQKLNIMNGTNPGQTCLYVDYNGKIIWGGIIWQRDYDSTTQMLKITGQEMLSYFKRRKITPLNTSYYNSGGITPTSVTYTNTDVCTVANDLLVNYTALVNYPNQGVTRYGSIGLRGSSTTAGFNITRTYFDFELKEVYQAVKDLSDGLDSSSATPFFDFCITYSYDGSGNPVKQFTMLTPYQSYTGSNPVFQFPGNIAEYSYSEDATNTVNALFGLGYGANSNKTIAVALDNSYTNQGSINSTNGNAAILEDVQSFVDVEDNNLLNALTLGQLNARSGITLPGSGGTYISAPEVLQVVLPPYVDPYLGTFAVGDFARVILRDDRFPSGYDYLKWRVHVISVEPGENGASRVTVTLARALYNFGTSWIVAQ